MKIAIVGNPDTILGFKAVGIEPHPISNKEEGSSVINSFRKSQEYGIVLITEDIAELLGEELAVLEEQTLPAVIRIPSSRGSTGEGLRALKRIVERAVGSDILG